MSDIKLGGKYLCSECGNVHGTALSSCKANYPDLPIETTVPAAKTVMPEKLTVTPTKSREQRLLDGEDFLAMPCVVGHVDGMKHKHYTLTTAAEANTRKAVREILEKVKIFVQDSCSNSDDPFLYLDDSHRGFVIGQFLRINSSIDKLLIQYREPTETNSGN